MLKKWSKSHDPMKLTNIKSVHVLCVTEVVQPTLEIAFASLDNVKRAGVQGSRYGLFVVSA